jgi:flagellar hook-length control protein FliK
VTLDLNDHQMQLTFVSSHASVRAAVEAAMPQLRATLADNGISLGNTSVSAESQSQAQAQAETAFSQGQGRAPDHRAYPSRQLPDNAAPVAQSVAATHRPGGSLAVDTYA